MSTIKKYLKKGIYKIAKVSKKLQQNSSETVTNENDKEVRKKRYTYICKKDKKLLIILASILMDEYQKTIDLLDNTSTN